MFLPAIVSHTQPRQVRLPKLTLNREMTSPDVCFHDLSYISLLWLMICARRLGDNWLLSFAYVIPATLTHRRASSATFNLISSFHTNWVINFRLFNCTTTVDNRRDVTSRTESSDESRREKDLRASPDSVHYRRLFNPLMPTSIVLLAREKNFRFQHRSAQFSFLNRHKVNQLVSAFTISVSYWTWDALF